MVMKDIVLLTGAVSQNQAYLQAMVKQGEYILKCAFYMGRPGKISA